MNTLREFVEYKLTHCDKTAEASGYPLVMNNCKKNKKMKQLMLYGNTVQDGTPTPDAPVEVVSVGEPTVNLTTAYEICKDFSAYTEVIEDGRNCVRYTDSNTTKSNPFGFKENTQYTVSFDCKLEKGQWGTDETIPTSYTMVFHYTDGTMGAASTQDGIAMSVRGVWQSKTMTSQAGKTVLGIGTRSYQYQNYNYIDVNTFQVQEGTATEYEPYGKYKIPIVTRGVNLLKDARDIYNGGGSKVAHSYAEVIEDGRECIKFTSASGVTYDKIKFKENTQYTFSFDCKDFVHDSDFTGSYDIPLGIWYTDGNRKLITIPKNSDWTKLILVSAANKTISHIGIISFTNYTTMYIDINTFQIQEGTTATEYEPYVEPVTTNIFLNEPLRKLGDYVDYIDFKENKVVRKCCKKYLKSCNWNSNVAEYVSGIYCFTGIDNSILPTLQNSNGGIGYSNVFPLIKSHQQEKHTYAILMHTWASNIQAVIPAEYLSEKSVQAFKTWITDNNAYMIRVLAEPTQEPITYEIPKLNAKTSIIEVDTSILPTNAYGKYILK